MQLVLMFMAAVVLAGCFIWQITQNDSKVPEAPDHGVLIPLTDNGPDQLQNGMSDESMNQIGGGDSFQSTAPVSNNSSGDQSVAQPSY